MTRTKNDTDSRVNRGGGWHNGEPSWVRAASRDARVPAGRSGDIGFRTSLPVRQPVTHTKGLAP
jgi:formylglycine-generating enzyme required for sulfatase activity